MLVFFVRIAVDSARSLVTLQKSRVGRPLSPHDVLLSASRSMRFERDTVIDCSLEEMMALHFLLANSVSASDRLPG